MTEEERTRLLELLRHEGPFTADEEAELDDLTARAQ